jgi:hypothetical protein
MGLQLDYPNKVFREITTSDGCYAVPSTSAISLIISEKFQDDTGVRELIEKFFANSRLKQK